MPNKVDQIIARTIHAFEGISGIDAVVLGGSRATGTANATSDIDIGIYYDDSFFDLRSFKMKAATIDDEHRNDAITDLGDWGPWINGGGWLKVDGMAVDILFRNTKKVIAVIDDCQNGKLSVDYQCGHPFGFVNSIYMGEVVYSQILSQGNELIAEQKSGLENFPETYRKAAINKFLWECDFSLLCGRKAIDKNDIIYAAGSLFRGVVSLLQVLYAVNGMYMLNEKGSLDRLLKQPNAYIPDNFAGDVQAALSGLREGCLQGCFDKIQEQYNTILRNCNHT